MRCSSVVPLAQWVEVALAVGTAVDDGLDVIAAAAEPLKHPEPHAGRHRGVVGSADPFGQINMGKVNGWQTLSTKLIDQPIDFAA
jgi:hypothetical protein